MTVNGCVTSLLPFLLLGCLKGTAQQKKWAPYLSKVWVADQGDGTYRNPILFADYSDPDAIRVGDNYYLVSSSFDAVPGLPLLHSKDLVNWTIVGHALARQVPDAHFSQTQHGNGVWAPSIRYRQGIFYIYYPDPDYGIYLTTAKNITGPWSPPLLVQAGKGLIDPCPLWDDDGRVYLVHAFAGSRAGIKSVLVIEQLNTAGTKVVGKPILVFDGHAHQPTVEGPKIYKRNGFYYIFAPAGGVVTGWQLVLRSTNIYGPYDERIVMDQGGTTVNGPHQGAWVTTQTGEDWFLHFQDRGAYGRVLHLQPMQWKDNWPVIGIDRNGTGKGEPVPAWKKPNVGKTYPITCPEESDEFNESAPGLQWQWQANPQPDWILMHRAKGCLRMKAVTMPDTAKNYWDVPAVFLQKFPAETFSATTRLHFTPKANGDRFGLVIMGMSYASISVLKKEDGLYLTYNNCIKAEQGAAEKEMGSVKIPVPDIFLRVSVVAGAVCVFSYSIDGTEFREIGGPFTAEKGKWIGAKMGLFCSSGKGIHSGGFADVDWFRVLSGKGKQSD